MQDFAEDFASPNIPSDDATGTTALGLIGYQHGGDLEHALYQEHLECADLLLAYGADINHQDENGNTPLMHAADQDNLPFTRWLLDHGARTTIINKDGWTAMNWSFDFAYQMGDASMGKEVRELLYRYT